MSPPTYGLSDQAIQKIRAVFKKFPGVLSATLYGSRALGREKPGSDIDLTLTAPNLGTSDLLKIENELEELFLPHKIDLSLYHQIEDSDLREHIERVGLLFYSASD